VRLDLVRVGLLTISVMRLNAALNALSDAYPTLAAVSETDAPARISRLAKCMRHWVR
jgi:hypothetical protein